MMKMATGEGFPLWQGAGTGLDWFSVAMEASGGGTPDLLCSSKFLGYMGIYVSVGTTPMGSRESLLQLQGAGSREERDQRSVKHTGRLPRFGPRRA